VGLRVAREIMLGRGVQLHDIGQLTGCFLADLEACSVHLEMRAHALGTAGG